MKNYNLHVADDGTCTLTLVPVPVPVPPAPLPPVPSRLMNIHGANLTGGGTYYGEWGPTGPMDGTNYLFVSNPEVKALVDGGCNCFRVVFAWEAVQATPFGVLGWYSVYWERLKGLVLYIRSLGAKVLLDIHGEHDDGFAKYKGEFLREGLADFWGKMAAVFGEDGGIMYGLTNEPHDMPAATWFAAAQLCVNAIRNNGGRGTIWAPGTDWTGAANWTTNNGPAWNLTDPGNNLGFQVHLYMDADAGGGSTTVVSPTVGSDRMKKCVSWARSKGLKVLLAEVGCKATSPNATAAWKDLHAFMLANRDVCEGFLWWASGSKAWWSGYAFQLAPGNAQWTMLQATGLK